ncbi:WcaI family glycosyltransferase [Chitinophaga sp. 30R24]|uniref:WcaI family glycosyltransferase n=1 Tax=Chitinophaga sp. 30R24 TaxID=3248838 RepID=UPI003B91294A
MRILVYGINYAPELTGIGKYTAEMCAWLAARGHKVQVITALPYYPEWRIHPAYKGKKWYKENIDGVWVYRCPLYVPAAIDTKKRILHEFSFLASAFPLWCKTFFQKKFDIVFCIAPPFHLGFLPLLYARLKRSIMISHIQDLQIDAAKDLGMIRNQSFLNLLLGGEKFILQRTIVSTISLGMQQKIIRKDIPPARMMMLPNWVDEKVVKPLDKAASLRTAFNLSVTDKVILYAGNLGEKQGLESIVEVAREFSHRPEVQFVICGAGGGKGKLMKLVAQSGLDNIRFFPLQPQEKLPALLATADIHLVLQKKSASDLVMPSKLTGILSAGGCPIVTASPGTTLYEVVKEHQVGIIVEPESVSALKKGIEEALGADLEKYRKNARQYAVEYLSKEKIMARLETDLLRLVRDDESVALR